MSSVSGTALAEQDAEIAAKQRRAVEVSIGRISGSRDRPAMIAARVFGRRSISQAAAISATHAEPEHLAMRAQEFRQRR